jgi:hypothetical protein
VRRTRLAIGVVSLVAGVLLLLLGADVRSWHRTLRDDTIRASVTPEKPAHDRAPTKLPSSWSGAALGVDWNRRWLDALQRFEVAYHVTYRKQQLTNDDYRLLNAAERALGKLTQDPDPARASRAYNLLSVLVFREAYPGTVVVRRLVQESLSDLQTAVRLDSRDEAAKENLELTLRVLVAVDLSPQQARAPGTRRANAKTGGFQGPPGAGY